MSKSFFRVIWDVHKNCFDIRLIYMMFLPRYIDKLSFFHIISIVFKKPFIISLLSFFEIWWSKISCCIVIDKILISTICRKSTGTKHALRCEAYPRENHIELFIKSCKTPCLFFFTRPKIINRKLHSIITKVASFFMGLLTNNKRYIIWKSDWLVS